MAPVGVVEEEEEEVCFILGCRPLEIEKTVRWQQVIYLVYTCWHTNY